MMLTEEPLPPGLSRASCAWHRCHLGFCAPPICRWWVAAAIPMGGMVMPGRHCGVSYSRQDPAFRGRELTTPSWGWGDVRAQSTEASQLRMGGGGSTRPVAPFARRRPRPGHRAA